MLKLMPFQTKLAAAGLAAAFFILASHSAAAQTAADAATPSAQTVTMPASREAVADTTVTAVRFAYDVDFETYFDNNEHPNTVLRPSMTIFGARLTPSAGISVEQNNGARHNVMLGVDIMKDFGKGPDAAPGTEYSSKYATSDLFRQVLFYYQLKYNFCNTEMRITAGIFPKRLSPAEYSDVFFSDSLQYYRPNYEGILFSFYRPKSYYELGCDWIGTMGTYDRERFMVFSYGRSQLKQWLSIGWAFYLYHYANSETVVGVVDNVLINPWVCFDITHKTSLQKLSFNVGWIQAAQQDRERDTGYDMPGGGQFIFEARKWNVGILNNIYVGKNLMPYYDTADAGGYKYGNSLYLGNSYYRLFEDGDTSSIGMYDRLDIYYEPRICDFMNFRLNMRFHFTQEGYTGCQQLISLVFNLNRLLKR